MPVFIFLQINFIIFFIYIALPEPIFTTSPFIFNLNILNIALMTSSTSIKSLYCFPSEQGKVFLSKQDLIIKGIILLASCFYHKLDTTLLLHKEIFFSAVL